MKVTNHTKLIRMLTVNNIYDYYILIIFNRINSCIGNLFFNLLHLM